MTVIAVAAVIFWLTGCAPTGPAPVVSLDRSDVPSETIGSAAARPERYRVSKGETLYSIAWAYDLDYRALASWNRVPPPYRIYPDQQLRLTPPPRPKPEAATQRSTATVSKPKPVVSKPKPVVSEPVREKSPPPRHEPRPVSKPVAKPTKPVTTTVSDGSLHWVWPTRGSVVQTFRKGDRTRQGIRIAGNVGQSVKAAESGRVVYTGSGLPGYGKLIIIKHNKNYLSAYGFNRKLLVKDGKKVAKGERVAEMGRSADGKALLHFEIRRRDTPLNPLKFLPR